MKKLSAKILMIPVLLSVAACSTVHHQKTADLPQSGQTGEPLIAPAPEPPADLKYTVERGDILSGIARKTTANGDNWHKIALYNGINNPSDIKVGDVIMIPGDMLRPSLRQSATTPDHAAPGSQSASTSTVNIVTAESIESFNTVSGEDKPEKALTEIPKDTPASAELKEPAPSRITVEGSYYPKAIYNKPNYTGDLLIRVSPGTLLEYIGDVDDWVEVQLESGSGFIHRSDVRKGPAPESGTTAINTF